MNILGVTIDQIGSVSILVFIVRAGWELLSDGMRVLLDASIDFSTLDSVREIIRSEPLVGEIKSLMGRSAGRFRFLQATITLKTDNLERAHQIGEAIEKKSAIRLRMSKRWLSTTYLARDLMFESLCPSKAVRTG